MKISQKGIELIKSLEGCPVNKEGKCYAYKDSVGVWTIGYGTTNADKSITGVTIKEGLVIAKSKAEEWLAASIDKKYGPNVMKYDSIYHWNQNQYDALVSFAYNVGSIDQLVQSGRRTITEISDKILAYNKAGGEVLVGLTRRRQAEKQLFDTVIVTNNSPSSKKTNTVQKTSTAVSKSSSYKAKVTAKSGLNIRKESNSKSAKLGALEYGTNVTITQTKNGWGKTSITLNKKKVTGWIYLKYIKKI